MTLIALQVPHCSQSPGQIVAILCSRHRKILAHFRNGMYNTMALKRYKKVGNSPSSSKLINMVALSKFFVTVACMSGVAMAAPSSNAGYKAGLMKRQFGVENTVPSAIAELGVSVAQILARIDSVDVIDPSLIASDIADLQGAYSNSTATLTTAPPLQGGVLNPIVFGTTLSFSGTLRSTASALAAVADSGDLSTSIASLDSAIAGTVTQYGTSAPGSAGLLTQSIADSDESFIIAGLNNTHNALGLGQ